MTSRIPRRRARFGPLIAALMLASPLAAQQPAPSYPALSEADPVEALSRYLRMLAANPRDLASLTGAGRAALAVGDANAALGFYARAEEIAPRNGRIKAGLAAALVQMEQPRTALKLFDEAVALGVPVGEIAADRGLAHDLVGDNRSAQTDYTLALRAREDDETLRRLALSMAISGDRAGALTMLDPLLRRNDGAAVRARAFILALTGDQAGATKVVQAAMPGAQATVMANFLNRLKTLNPAQKALAVNFGYFPSDGRAYSAAELFADARSARPPGAASPAAAALIPSGAPLGSRPAGASPDALDAARRRPGTIALVDVPPPAHVLGAPIPGRVTPGSGRSAAVVSEAPAAPSTAPLSTLPRVAAGGPAVPASAAAVGRARSSTSIDADIPAPGFSGVTQPSTTMPATSGISRGSGGANVPTPVAGVRPVSTVGLLGGPIMSSGGSPLAAEAARGLSTVTPAPAPVVVRPASGGVVGSVDLPGSTIVLPPHVRPAVRLPAETAPIRLAAASPAAPRVAAKPEAKESPAESTAKASKGGDKPSSDAKVAAVKADPKSGAKAAAGAKPKPGDKTERDNAKPDSAKADKAKSDSAKADKVKSDPKAKGDAKSAKDGKALKTAATRTAAADKAKADTKEKGDTAKGKVAERYWVQVASGSNKANLDKAWTNVKAKAPALLNGRSTYTAPWRASNRLLVGPFKSEEEAQAEVNRLAKAGVGGIQFTSRAGADVSKVVAE
jgi:tetratricopeptide (TPR) repeat protein